MTKVIQSIDFDNLTPFERFQFEKYGDILKEVPDDGNIENGLIEASRFREWSNVLHDQYLLSFEK